MEQTRSPKIYAALAAAMADIGPVGKNKEITEGQKYKYRSLEDIYNAVNEAFAKHKIVTAMKIVNRMDSVRTSKHGTTMYHCLCRYEVSFFAEDGSSHVSTIDSEGLDTGDKASNKAVSFAHKNAITTTLCLAYDDMTDGDSERPELKDDKKTSVSRPSTETKKAEAPKLKPAKDMKKEELAVYVCPLGKFKGKKLMDINYADLSSYGDYMAAVMQSGKKEGKPKNLQAEHFFDVVDAWLALEAQL